MLFQETLHSPNWKKTTTKNGVEIFTLDGEGNQTGIMGVAEFPYNYEVIMAALKDPEIPFKANSFADKLEILEDVGENTKILYMRFKGMLMVAGRDFVNCSTITYMKEKDRQGKREREMPCNLHVSFYR